ARSSAAQKKKGRPCEEAGPRTPNACCLVHAPPVAAPILCENREEHLVEILTLLFERLAEDAFLHGAHLSQRAVAAAVLDGGARFEAANADRVERKLEDQLRAGLEDARAPELRADGETP